jgi:hypothetical protein
MYFKGSCGLGEPAHLSRGLLSFKRNQPPSGNTPGPARKSQHNDYMGTNFLDRIRNERLTGK